MMKDKRELFVIVEDMADHLPIEDPNKGAGCEQNMRMSILTWPSSFQPRPASPAMTRTGGGGQCGDNGESVLLIAEAASVNDESS